MNKQEKIVHRVVTFLDRRELDFLDNIGKDILFSTGNKVPRSTILRELIDIFLPATPRLEKNRGYKNLVSTLKERIDHEKKEEK